MFDLRPCCNGADATVDFRRFGAGLVGNGGTCVICLEVGRWDVNPSGDSFTGGGGVHMLCNLMWNVPRSSLRQRIDHLEDF